MIIVKSYLLKSIVGQVTLHLLECRDIVTKEDILFYVSNNRSALGLDNNQIQNIKSALNRKNLN